MPIEKPSLSPQQLNYFRTFGFLKLKGLFRDDIDRIGDGFDALFRKLEPDMVLADDPLQRTGNATFPEHRRRILHPFVERSDELRWLLDDARILGVAESILGPRFEQAPPTDASIFDCDTSWHADLYTAPIERFHIKLSLYLDRQLDEHGAIRFIPGSNFHESQYARALRNELYGDNERVRRNFGVECHEIPSFAIESEPGDLVCWNYRTLHASFHGFHGRRLLSISFREPAGDDASRRGSDG